MNCNLEITYPRAFLLMDYTEKFCAWFLKVCPGKGDLTPEGYTSETIMMAPASGFYSDPDLGKNQVRLAYVLEKNKIQRALVILEKALLNIKI